MGRRITNDVIVCATVVYGRTMVAVLNGETSPNGRRQSSMKNFDLGSFILGMEFMLIVIAIAISSA